MSDLHKRSIAPNISKLSFDGSNAAIEDIAGRSSKDPALNSSPSINNNNHGFASSMVIFMVVGVLVVVLIAWLFIRNAQLQSNARNKTGNDSAITDKSLDGFIDNGKLVAQDGLVVSPTGQPTKPISGQIYVDDTTNQPTILL